MLQAARESGTRDVCAVTVTARPLAPDTRGDIETFWTSHARLATVAALLVPALTITAFAALPFGRPASHELRKEGSVARPAVGSSSRGITGRILDANGRPAARASVRVISLDGPPRASATTTDLDGRFRFEAFAARRLRIVAEDEGDGFVESAELGEASKAVVLVLAHAANVTGVVRDERGVPVSHATVKAEGGSSAMPKTTTTDDEGRYTLERVAPDADRITAWSHGFVPATRALVRGGGELDMTLPTSHPIRGLVTGPTGRAVAGARITACSDAAVEAAVSDAFGAFELPASTAGCTALAAHPRFSAARPVSIEAGRALTIRLATGGAIAGAFVDGRGAPVNSFSVSIDSFSAAEGEEQTESRAGETTDQLHGAFRIDGLPAGTYALRASTPEGLTSETVTVEVPRGKVVRGLRLMLGGSQEVIEMEGEGAMPTPDVAVESVGEP
jgi:hypothetical protein